MAGYDKKSAELYNQLRAQGVPPVQAAKQAGVGYLDLVNAQRQDGDGRGPISGAYRLGSNGLLGPRDPSPAPPIPDEITIEDPVTVTTTRETVSVPVTEPLPTPTVVDRLTTSARNSAEADAFLRTAQPNQALPGPTPITPNSYTVTSTEAVSGGGVTTVVATPPISTPASRQAQAQADATLAEIEALQLENSGFGPGPQLTEAQMAANDARILQLTERYDSQRAAATAAEQPGVPSITTVPNTTTTVSTTLFETSAENTPLSAAESEAFDPNFDPNAGFPALTPTVIEADPTVIQDETGAISNLRRNPETGDIFEPLPPEVDPNAGFPASLPESVSAFESGYPDPDAEFDPNAGFPPLTPASTESEVVPGFSSDPRIAGEDVSLSEIETEPEPVDSPYIDEEEGTLVDFNTGERVTAGQAQASAAIAQSAVNNARNQQSIREQRRNNPDSADWRVRIRLAPNANYLYNADDPGILAPLSSNSGSDGVIFPYTPTVQTVYKANYNSYDLTHSNYRGFFYQSSVVDDIQITGTFTAQDTLEAEYLLAVIHFFRSASKMFYGQDTQRGAPPPLVYLSAFGQFQYVDAPCVISQFNYNLPADVDYIRARSPNQDGTNLLKRRERQSVPTNVFQAAWNRITTSGLPRGGQVFQPPPPRLGLNGPTYVPTRIDITVVLHPMQTRKQVSQQFSLKEYGAGRLQPKGYW